MQLAAPNLAQAGTKASKEEFENKYKPTAVATKALSVENAKSVCENVDIVICMPRTTSASSGSLLKPNKEYTMQIRIFLGQKGGNGQFPSLLSTSLPEVKQVFAW